jgi:hypothetical protein
MRGNERSHWRWVVDGVIRATRRTIRGILLSRNVDENKVITHEELSLASLLAV